MQEHVKRDFSFATANVHRRAMQHLFFLREAMEGIDADITRFEDMVTDLLFQKELIEEDDPNAFLLVSTIGSTIARIQVSISLLKNQKVSTEASLTNIGFINKELCDVAAAIDNIPHV